MVKVGMIVAGVTVGVLSLIVILIILLAMGVFDEDEPENQDYVDSEFVNNRWVTTPKRYGAKESKASKDNHS